MKDSVGAPTALGALQSKNTLRSSHPRQVLYDWVSSGREDIGHFPSGPLKTALLSRRSTSVTTRPVEIWLCLADKTKILLFLFFLF